MSPELEEACRRAIHVLRPEGPTLRAGRAALFVLGLLGWRRTAALLGVPPFVWTVELGYWIVARRRRFFGRFLFRNLPSERVNTLREEG